MTDPGKPVERFLKQLGRPFLGEELFDRIADTVFFVKDAGGRYVAVNDTLALRCGLKHKNDLIGRKAGEVFPPHLAVRIEKQDQLVIAEKILIQGVLELHIYPDRSQGWCLTWKEPLIAEDGRVAGLSGISRDLQPLPGAHLENQSLSETLDHIRDHIDQPLRLPELAARAGLSDFRFDQRVRALFGISAGQYVKRARIDLACSRLRHTDASISAIALECGYGDQAAFTRQFRKSVGLTPGRYRKQFR